jgi:DNA-binding Xre family transcriptional regulator
MMYGKPVKLRIRELRAQWGMSQAGLAKKAGMSAVAISNLESGTIRRIELETIGKLCGAFYCSPNDLFELPTPTEAEIVARQKRAIEEVLESMTYEGPYDPFDPDTLDAELAEFTDRRLKASLKVADKIDSYKTSKRKQTSTSQARSRRKSDKMEDSK